MERTCLIFILLIGIFAFLFGGIAGSNNRYTKKEIVKHQCGHYDSQTGEFVWNK